MIMTFFRREVEPNVDRLRTPAAFNSTSWARKIAKTSSRSIIHWKLISGTRTFQDFSRHHSTSSLKPGALASRRWRRAARKRALDARSS